LVFITQRDTEKAQRTTELVIIFNDLPYGNSKNKISRRSEN
jgi:hypothetical protein